MIDFSCNHFELFGLPERYRVDPASLEHAWRALQSEVHPDRFATASDRERRAALQSSARVNEAYRALKDPVMRAQYLLSLRGVDSLNETDTDLPIDFLEEQLERREAVSEAFEARDAGAVEASLAAVRAEYSALEAQLAALLDSEGAWGTARMSVRKLKFLAKLASDIDAILGELES